MKHEKSCGTIIINQDRVLLIGAKDDNGELFWSFPKGHQENGETDTATALRETTEEVGLEVQIIDPTPIVVSHPIHNGTELKYIYLFLARIVSGKINLQPDEVEIIKWANFDEANMLLVDYYRMAWSEARQKDRKRIE